ncbi:MAG: hypothetical protein C0597_15745 [Marinilabiliales bacterium]|nr:MAG: hypothetical protein C0597_15745 [Marinilabiliales bacterium]
MKKQYYWKLWDAANYITGFAATQALAFAFIFISGPEMVDHIKYWYQLAGMAFFIVLGCIIYCGGVYKSIQWAQKIIIKEEELDLELEENQFIVHTMKRSSWGRIIAIIFFTVLDLTVLYIVGSLNIHS